MLAMLNSGGLMSSILVSIIIPTYGSNTDPLRAIDSGLKQDHEQVEIIVVDDNGRGTDQQKANEKLFSVYSNEPRFRYIIHDNNKGGSAARNTGVANSSGEYLCFLDDDDYLSDLSKIRVQVERCKSLDSTWAGTYSACDIYRGDEFVRHIEPTLSGDLLVPYLEGKLRLETAAPVIRREAYESIGGFDESFKRHQDWEFFSRIMDNFKILACPEVTYRRCYKIDVKRKKNSIYLEYMNKYTSSMRNELKSLPDKQLNKLLKRKYIQIVMSMLHGKEFKDAIHVMRDNRFGMGEYLKMIKGVFDYLVMRKKYGTHF